MKNSARPFFSVGLGKMVALRGFAANGNGASDSYQGTTSVVPTVMTGIKGFSPCDGAALHGRASAAKPHAFGKSACGRGVTAARPQLQGPAEVNRSPDRPDLCP